MILMGFTLALPVSIVTSPVLAQTSNPCPVVTPAEGVTTYCFPATTTSGLPSIAYVINNTSSGNGTFYYGNQTFTGNKISIVNSSIGKQVTVTIANGIDTLSTFTLVLPNDKPSILNGSITAVGVTIDNVVPFSSKTTYFLLQGTVTTGS